MFNALKINSTLALISAIVAEFFGSPILGLGFRISTEVAKLNVDVVWAVIAIAALAGSMFYGLIAVVERACTFWHPSYRSVIVAPSKKRLRRCEMTKKTLASIAGDCASRWPPARLWRRTS